MAATTDSWDDGLAVIQVVWRRRRFVGAVAATCVLATFAAVWWRAPVYEATANLLVVPSKAQPAQASASVLLSDLANLKEARSRRTVQALLESGSVNRQIYAALPPEVAKEFRGPAKLPVKIENPAGTEILKIHARSADTRAALGLADAVAQKAVELSRTINERASEEGGTRLESELARAQQEVVKANLALQRFCKQHNVTDLPAEMTGLTEQLIGVRNQLTTAQVSLDAKRAEIDAALRESKKEPVMVAGGSTTVTGPLLESVLGRSGILHGTAPKEDATASDSEEPGQPGETEAKAAPDKPSSPLMETVQQQPNPVLENLLVRSAGFQTDEADLSARVQAWEGSARRIERRYAELRRLEPEWKRLSGAYTVLQQSYDAMLSNQQELEVSRTARLPEAQIVSAAELSPYPVAPRRVFDLAAALVLGLLIGLVGALFLERRTGLYATAESGGVIVEAQDGELARR